MQYRRARQASRLAERVHRRQNGSTKHPEQGTHEVLLGVEGQDGDDLGMYRKGKPGRPTTEGGTIGSLISMVSMVSMVSRESIV